MSIVGWLKKLFGGGSRNGSMAGSSARDIDMISCEDALRLVHDFLDGELEGVSESNVKRHFDMCERCYPHLHLESTYREAVRRAAAGEEASPELKEKVAALLAGARSEE